MSDELRQSWKALARGAVVTLAAWSLVDTAIRTDSADDGARPTRRAEPDPRPVPDSTPSALVPRSPGKSFGPTWNRATGTSAGSTVRSTRSLPPGPPGCRLAGLEDFRGDARRLLLVAPKHGPPPLA